MITGILRYNSSNDRYGLTIMDIWKIDGFHCGQSVEVWDAETEHWISTIFGMQYQKPSFPKKKPVWYLIGTSYSGAALDGLKVRVTY